MTVSFAAGQAQFAAALLHPDRPIPPWLTGPDGQPTIRRFNVYRNNVMAGLQRVLHAAFPAIARLVGEEFFAALCRVFISSRPPRTPLLFDYGRDLPDFLDRFEPVAGLPYLADVARIEWAWIEAYHSQEAAPLSPETFALLPAHALADLRVMLHPSLRLVRSEFPALTIWQVNVSQQSTPVDLAAGREDALIIRSDAQVEVRSLPPGGAAYLRALRDGFCMLDATRSALAADARFVLSDNLRGLMNAGAFIAVFTP